jgi:hypothetical protein
MRQSKYARRSVNAPSAGACGTRYGSPAKGRSVGQLTARLRRRPLGVFDYIANCRRKFIHSCARHNDGVTAAVGFFGNSQELPSLVLTEFHVKVFPFDLELPGLNDVVHFPEKRRIVMPHGRKREEDSAQNSLDLNNFCRRLRQNQRVRRRDVCGAGRSAARAKSI